MTELILGAGGMLAPDLSRARVKLVSAGKRGVVHCANAGETTWYGLANSVLDTSLCERLTGQSPRPFIAVLDEHLRLRAEAARE